MQNQIPARLTETFHEFLQSNPTFLSTELPMVLSNGTDVSSSFHKVLTGMWGLYEINADTEDLFKVMLKDTYNEYYDYYLQIADGYYKDYDFTTGLTRVTESYGTDTGTSNSQSITVDLPNKQIDADDIYKYPDSGDKGSTSTSDSTSATTTTTYNDRYLELKNRFIRQIRNVFAEFAGRFSDCFSMVYGSW